MYWLVLVLDGILIPRLGVKSASKKTMKLLLTDIQIIGYNIMINPPRHTIIITVRRIVPNGKSPR